MTQTKLPYECMGLPWDDDICNFNGRVSDPLTEPRCPECQEILDNEDEIAKEIKREMLTPEDED